MHIEHIYKFIAILFFATLILSTSCSKRRELNDLGCVKGRGYFGDPYKYVGAMTKKEFYNYLDSPTRIIDGKVIKFDMRWTKIARPEECPTN